TLYHFHFCCGLGGGAAGFNRARPRVGNVFFTLKSGAQAASQPASSFSAPKEADSRGKRP
uniref:hypothetical protein n=1 Tax=Pseudomonas aeruginosa TaxID=287 RepID=UPI001EE76729